MKKVLCILFVVILTLTTVGCCAKVVKTETKVVEAIIVDVEYVPMKRIGGKTVKRADYDILLKYEDIEDWIDISHSEYYRYENLVGTSIEVNLVVKYYDDNTIKQYLNMIKD